LEDRDRRGPSGPHNFVPVQGRVKKRAADGQLEPEEAPQEPSVDAGVGQDAPARIGQDAPMDPLVWPVRNKGSVEDHSEDEYHTVQESKQQRIGLIESVVEAMEDETVTLATLEGKLQMRICEEAVDPSYIGSADADLLEEVIEQTDVGGVLSQLDDRVASFMMRSLCQAELPVDSGVKSASPGEEGESIFDPGSKMGLQADEAKDHWRYDSSNASWKRVIVVPHANFFHPGEGAAEEKQDEGPKLSSLRDCRWTIPDGVQPIKDNWKRDSGELEIGGDLVEWTGKAVFYER